MADKILLKRAGTPGKVPAAGDLTPGELAVNTADGKLYTKRDNGTVKEVGGAPTWGTVTGAIADQTDLQSALDGKVGTGDSRLTDAREWTADTVTQAEAEAGTATTRRAWTAQRVRQAIVAWWLTASTAFGRSVATAADATTARTTLGLGSAATKAVQTSSTDTTAGALMAVGAFGLGANLPVEDSSPWTYSRIKAWGGNATATEAPTPVVSVGVDLGYSANRRGQLAISLANELFFRGVTVDPIDATGWRKVFHDRNIVGTVSQSASVPTGAIIERGSNANGEYLRFADGTQKCWRKILTVSQVADTDFAFNWVFPAGFVNVNDTIVSAHVVAPVSTNTYKINKISSGPQSVSLGSIRVNCSVTQDYIYSLEAIGRWY